MRNLAVWLMALIVPLGKKLLVGLGVGVVSYAGYSALISQAKSAVIDQWGNLGAGTVAILSLGGVGQALGIILGALTARAALMAVDRFGRVTS